MEAINEIAEQVEVCPDRPESIPASAEPECAACRGSGYVVENTQARPCLCTVEARVRKSLPKRYWSATLGDFSPEIVRQALEWMLDPKEGLRLSGPTGVGKTHLAAALVRHRREQNLPAKFAQMSAVCRDVRDCFSRGTSDRELLMKLLNAPFLVLDDVGAGSLSDFERRTTLEILAERVNECRPTVVTTNWSIQEISKLMDDRIASRLASFTRIEMGDRDRRLCHAQYVAAGV